LSAERGEPLAVALLAAGKIILSRSPKLHRPRSATCMRGGCEGCLMRVQGTPNVMTCLEPAQGDERIEAQNVVGSRKADLLRVNDWLFPHGFDHHHFMTDVPALGPIVQSFARKISGLGRLPSDVQPMHPARTLEADVVVVGGGLAGLVVTSRLEAQDKRVVLVDDGVRLGGSLHVLPQHADLLDSLNPKRATVFVRATAAGVYLGELVVATSEGAVVVRAKDMVFATGAHDGVLAFPGNDLPGVFSARALCLLHTYGVEPEENFVVVGDGFWADELVRRMGDRVMRVKEDLVVAVRGTSTVKGITIQDGERKKALSTQVIAVAAAGAPAFELAAQAGAKVRFEADRGYAIECDGDGRAGNGLWAVGECSGQDFDIDAIVKSAERCVKALMR
jgi:sarcosine oxidase, subunit alpha